MTPRQPPQGGCQHTRTNTPASLRTCTTSPAAVPMRGDGYTSSSGSAGAPRAGAGAAEEGCADLCRALWNNRSLLRLSLGGAPLSWQAGLTLALALHRHHPRLELLDLQACRLLPWSLAVVLHACARSRGPFKSLNIAGAAPSPPSSCNMHTASGTQRATILH